MSVIKHTDVIPDPKAVNQDKKNLLFSVSKSVLQHVYSLCINCVLGLVSDQ